MEIQDFVKEYESQTNEELLCLSLDSDQLIPEASAALTTELARRQLNTFKQLNAFREEEKQRKAELSRDPGPMFFIAPYGIGRRRFGKAEYTYSSDTGIERFRTTVFAVLFWFPFIPTGTFLVERIRGSVSSRMNVLEKLPLSWKQVLTVWVVATASLLGFILLFPSLFRLLIH